MTVWGRIFADKCNNIQIAIGKKKEIYMQFSSGAMAEENFCIYDNPPLDALTDMRDVLNQAIEYLENAKEG